ncbi:hypothetical protein [Azospirillum sp.]|uniref:hypothetical protein n=1 Tax=Azospirillum sp. TaxID=34012 RepID=UPI002D751455|nr:hypothetical protein [Azospirillum sp.]HYD64158.1 hypothetical protein [Azospirillum sp.]
MLGEAQYPYTGERMTARSDDVPRNWQYIAGLRPDDLIPEMGQNDFDAGATETVIQFGPDALVCQGNGRPVDAEGWERLTWFLGAGDQVRAKRRSLGIKNHGLKACFSIGDELLIRSEGKRVRQTLWGNGRNAPPYPSTNEKPVDDPDAPLVGTRIEVRYRRTTIVVPVGERRQLAARDDAFIEEVFRTAAHGIPSRLIAGIRPGVRERYRFELHHYRLGNVTYSFRCAKPTAMAGLTVFTRSCRVSGDAARALGVQDLVEQVAMMPLEATVEEEEATPNFYLRPEPAVGKRQRRRRPILVEASWRLDSSRRPVPAEGMLRYPISYPTYGAGTHTGIGVHYSAPFISELDRHAPSDQDKEWNGRLLASCDRVFALALEKVLIPRHGARALRLLCEPTEPTAERLRALLAGMLERLVLPAMSGGGRKTRWRGGPLAVPHHVWNRNRISRTLAVLCPPGMAVLHPAVPGPIVAALAEMPGGTCIAFTEEDVLDRLRPKAQRGVPWPEEAVRTAPQGNPALAALHLDALLQMFDRSGVTPPSATGIYLPDTEGVPTPFERLRKGVALPRGTEGIDIPPILHPTLARHRLLKRKNWEMAVFGFDQLIGDGLLARAPDTDRRMFFTWLSRHPAAVLRSVWSGLASLALWPDADGNLRPISQLCAPETAALDRAMGNSIARPDKAVLSLERRLASRGVRLALRRKPSPGELLSMLRERLSAFPKDRPLAPQERTAFAVFETDLAAIPADLLKPLVSEAKALGHDGLLRSPADMVRYTAEIQPLRLLPRYLMQRAETALDAAFPPARHPRHAMLVATLRADPTNSKACTPRLQALLHAARRESVADPGVADIPFIPFGDGHQSPSRLAFGSSNIWGEWRLEIPTASLPEATRALYAQVGVIGGEPTVESSRSFFRWLSEQPSATLELHLGQIIRIFAHRSGSRAWWNKDIGIPCLPVDGPNGIQLISRAQATDPAYRCFIDDFPALAGVLRDMRPRPDLRLAIDHAPGVATSIAGILRGVEMRSLRQAAGAPLDVGFEDEIPVPEWVGQILEALRSPRMARELQKRLAQLDVDPGLLNSRWHSNLRAVAQIRAAASLTARYRLSRRKYTVPVDSVAHAESGSLWLRVGSPEELKRRFFRAIIDLVFRPGAQKHLAASLAEALESEIEEARRPLRQQEGEIAHDEQPQGRITHHSDGRGGVRGHKPSPQPLAGGDGAPVGRSPRKERTIFPDEKQHIRSLKADQYFWNCQIALASEQPEALSPAGSYTADEVNRQGVVQAHHPDPVALGGPRHAGNLLILALTHHHPAARLFTRADVTAALRATCPRRTVCFQVGGETVELTGCIAEVVSRVNGESIRMFFTDHHREYWLAHAAPGPSPAGQTEAQDAAVRAKTVPSQV